MDNFGNVRIRRVPEAEVSRLENVPILSLDEARAEHAQRMNTLLSYRSSAWHPARDDNLRGLLAREREDSSTRVSRQCFPCKRPFAISWTLRDHV
jgi:hypothetical protein